MSFLSDFFFTQHNVLQPHLFYRKLWGNVLFVGQIVFCCVQITYTAPITTHIFSILSLDGHWFLICFILHIVAVSVAMKMSLRNADFIFWDALKIQRAGSQGKPSMGDSYSSFLLSGFERVLSTQLCCSDLFWSLFIADSWACLRVSFISPYCFSML